MMAIKQKKSAWVACRWIRPMLAKPRFGDNMDQAHQRPERRHVADLALEAVWIADEHTELDAEHARILSRFGFGSGEWLPGRPR
jgi:hypothetical protein